MDEKRTLGWTSGMLQCLRENEDVMIKEIEKNSKMYKEKRSKSPLGLH